MDSIIAAMSATFILLKPLIEVKSSYRRSVYVIAKSIACLIAHTQKSIHGSQYLTSVTEAVIT